jgi:hypothetical protein
MKRTIVALALVSSAAYRGRALVGSATRATRGRTRSAGRYWRGVGKSPPLAESLLLLGAIHLLRERQPAMPRRRHARRRSRSSRWWACRQILRNAGAAMAGRSQPADTGEHPARHARQGTTNKSGRGAPNTNTATSGATTTGTATAASVCGTAAAYWTASLHARSTLSRLHDGGAGTLAIQRAARTLTKRMAQGRSLGYRFQDSERGRRVYDPTFSNN